MKIILKDLEFYAYHGVHPEEQTIGGLYLVNISIEMKTHAASITALNQTIDYTKVYAIIKQLMLQPTQLLETICIAFANFILQEFTLADVVEISIVKKHPPISNFMGSVGVNYTKKR